MIPTHRALMAVALLAVALATPAVASPRIGPIRLSGIEITPARARPNLLSNPGFEHGGLAAIPEGWQWGRGATNATCSVDQKVSHGGRRSLRITNGTPFGPNVYGMLLQPRAVRLEAGKAYTCSAWVRSDEPGQLGLLTGGGWQYRVYARPTRGEWSHIAMTFRPGAADLDCVVRVTTESPTACAWIDDLKLEEGEAASPDPADMTAPAPRLWPEAAESEIEGDGAFGVRFVLTTPRPVTLRATANIDGGGRASAPVTAPAGVWTITVRGTTDMPDDRPCTLRLGLSDAVVTVAASVRLRFQSPSSALGRIAAVRARLPGLRAAVRRLAKAGADISYPACSLVTLEDFVGYAAEDARRGEVRRAIQQAGDLERIAGRLARETAGAHPGGRALPGVPRYTGERRPVIRDGSFIAPVRMPGGRVTERPVFFNGFGHFARVVTDLEKWPAYGVNMIQVEFGPNSVFPEDGRVDTTHVSDVRRVLDRAQKVGVAVCLLISPHYMPEWALRRWSKLRRPNAGFLSYCLHAPEGQALLRDFVHTALAPLKDHPALQSICLSNEPINREEPCEYARAEWARWLARRHETVAAMNERWGTRYASFEEAPLPDPTGARPSNRIWIDFVRFNQEFFAGWHRMLADAVHEVAPDLPVHAKAMSWTFTNDSEIASGYGVDATLFAGFSQINGNDSSSNFGFGLGEYALGWQLNAMSHDLQRSLLAAPILNSEDHLIPDRETRWIPAQHVAAVLWQAAIHGQGGSAIWVWERTFDPRSDFAGSIMHRPACAEIVGRTNMDLNRAALEVTAIQGAAPQVQILHSTAGAVWDLGANGGSIAKAYTALSFRGVKVGFITDRQLESGTKPTARLVILPSGSHVSDGAAAALTAWGGRIVALGEAAPMSRNEWDQPTAGRPQIERLVFNVAQTSERDVARQIWRRLRAWGIEPEVTAVDGGEPAWGVMIRSGATASGAVVNLCNMRNKPVTLRLMRAGRPVRGADVLSGSPTASAITLAPMEYRLLRLPRR